MDKRYYYFMWGGLFVLCAVAGFIPAKHELFTWIRVALAVVFFIPPAVLLYRAHKKAETGTFRLIAILSGCSLILSTMMLVLNILTVAESATVGNIMYYLLTVISVPMICMNNWALSLFAWAVLLVVAFRGLRMDKK